MRMNPAPLCVSCAAAFILLDFDLGFVLKQHKTWLWIETNCCVADEA